MNKQEQKPFKIDKRTFKICEAVRLGLDYYYMGPKDKRWLTIEEIEAATRILKKLHDGWWKVPQEWQKCGESKNEL